MAPNFNGWNEMGQYVLRELKRHGEALDAINKEVHETREAMVALSVKASVWGLLGGMIPVAILVLLYLLDKR